MKVAFDTNAFVYGEGLNGPDKQALILDLFDRLEPNAATIPLHVLGELFNILTRKARLPREEARRRVLIWTERAALLETTATAMLEAVELAARHRLSIWDALVLAVAAEAGCRVLLSEAMQDGFTWRGLTVVNPFATPPSPLLESVLRP